MPPIVQVNDLRKRYGDIEAVRGISFFVEPGEVFGLLGPNGAGKTTTVEILEGLRRADGGSATVAGGDVFSNPSGVKRRIGVQLQASAIPDNLLARGFTKPVLQQKANLEDVFLDLTGHEIRDA